MKSYNKEITDQLRKAEFNMIKHTPQPDMFHNGIESLHDTYDSSVVLYGAGRPSRYVAPGNTIQSFEPETLAVGAGLKRKRGRPKKCGDNGGSIWSTLGSVAKTAAPMAIPLMMAAGLPEKKKRGRKPKEDGGSFLSGLKKGFKTVGKTVAPIAKDVLVPVATNMAKDALTSYLTSGAAGAGLEKKKRGRPKKSDQGGSFLSGLKKGIKTVGKNVMPIAKDIAVPMATQALTSYLTSGAAGAGLKKKRAPSKRNLLIKEIMAKTGKSLPEASKYVKDTHLM
jgi:hypothetical protein